MRVLDTVEVRVRGVVQGVGFRPTVWRLAKDSKLVGEVFNDAQGVLIRISGKKNNLTQFLKRLETEAPPLAHIEAIEVKSLEAAPVFQDFRITGSCSGQNPRSNCCCR